MSFMNLDTRELVTFDKSDRGISFRQFCTNNQLSYSVMYQVHNGKRVAHKGWVTHTPH